MPRAAVASTLMTQLLCHARFRNGTARNVDGTDTIDLSGFALGGLEELQESATVTEGTFESGAPFVALDFGDDDVLTAAGLTVATMDSGDFLF
jgi:hypothetical protein